MRITERQLRRIVRQEILREADQGQGAEKPGDSKDVEDLIKVLEPALKRFRGPIGKAMSNKTEVADLIQALLNLLKDLTPAKETFTDLSAVQAASRDLAREKQGSASMKENARRRRRA